MNFRHDIGKMIFYMLFWPKRGLAPSDSYQDELNAFSVARIAKDELVIPKSEFTSNALKTLHGVLREYMHNDDNELESRIVPTTS